MEEPVRISSTSGLSGSATILAGRGTVSSTKSLWDPHKGTCSHQLRHPTMLRCSKAERAHTEKLSISTRYPVKLQ